MKFTIHLIAAARPNFMKIAPLYHGLKKQDWAIPVIVHTGQHYDLNMSDVFFQDLGLPEPDIHLGIGSGTHAEQTGRVMIAYEKILVEKRPDLVIVVGDVNSTMACTLAASKISYGDKSLHTTLHRAERSSSRAILKRSGPHGYVPSGISHQLVRRPLVAHLEAGLRSFDRTMPEEINRLVTDSLADILWTPSSDADENLLQEGVSKKKILRVGNIMIDSLEMLRDRIQKQNVYEEFGLETGNYGLVTLHRPSNVDNQQALKEICTTLTRISRNIPLVFPVHPRTRKNLQMNGLMDALEKERGMHLVEPLSYCRFMNVVFNCRFAITDSGGIQEETTYLGIPCLTMRTNTERPITITQGTNQLVSLKNLEERLQSVLSGNPPKKPKIELWDGCTADRIIGTAKAFLN